jgi:hypothetical protein
MCAMLYIEVGRSIYGWCVGASGYDYPARFFVLEDYYVAKKTCLYLSVEDDVYGPWIRREVAIDVTIDAPVPMPERITHELERAQDAFMREWLFYADDPCSEEQARAYAARDLAVQPMNIRADRLNKLSADDVVWTYASPGCDRNVIRTLSQRWTLDYVLD